MLVACAGVLPQGTAGAECGSCSVQVCVCVCVYEASPGQRSVPESSRTASVRFISKHTVLAARMTAPSPGTDRETTGQWQEEEDEDIWGAPAEEERGNRERFLVEPVHSLVARRRDDVFVFLKQQQAAHVPESTLIMKKRLHFCRGKKKVSIFYIIGRRTRKTSPGWIS